MRRAASPARDRSWSAGRDRPTTRSRASRSPFSKGSRCPAAGRHEQRDLRQSVTSVTRWRGPLVLRFRILATAAIGSRSRPRRNASTCGPSQGGSRARGSEGAPQRLTSSSVSDPDHLPRAARGQFRPTSSGGRWHRPRCRRLIEGLIGHSTDDDRATVGDVVRPGRGERIGPCRFHTSDRAARLDRQGAPWGRVGGRDERARAFTSDVQVVWFAVSRPTSRLRCLGR